MFANIYSSNNESLLKSFGPHKKLLAEDEGDMFYSIFPEEINKTIDYENRLEIKPFEYKSKF